MYSYLEKVRLKFEELYGVSAYTQSLKPRTLYVEYLESIAVKKLKIRNFAEKIKKELDHEN